MEVRESTAYRSPVKTLARFFERSRDRWKRKCLDAKLRVKRLQTKVSDLQASREAWKRQAREARAEVARLRAGQAEQKTAGG